MKKIGILGGTFNPIHIGHLRVAIHVLENFPLHQVLLSPTPQNPHKEKKGILPFHIRIHLLNLALNDLNLKNKLEISSHEENIQGPAYTYTSLVEFKNIHPNYSTYFILGFEDFIKIHSWYKGLELPTLSNFIVVQRGENDYKLFQKTIAQLWPTAQKQNQAYHVHNHSIHYLPLERLDVSSSYIRKLHLNSKNFSLLTTHSVENYILKNQIISKTWSE